MKLKKKEKGKRKLEENKICTLMQANKVEKPADEKEMLKRLKNLKEAEKSEGEWQVKKEKKKNFS